MTEPGLLGTVRDTVERDVAPSVHSHLGTIAVDAVRADGTVEISFGGACTACSLRKQTLLNAVYVAVKDIPGVTAIASPGVAISSRDLLSIKRYYDAPAAVVR